MSETLRDAIGDAIETTKAKATREQWEARAREVERLLPPGWDVRVEPHPGRQGFFHARVQFYVEADTSAISALEAVLAYYRSLQNTSASGRILLPPGVVR